MAKHEASQAVDSSYTYTLEEICANSEAAFGVKPEVIAGALYGSQKKRFTVEEVRALIETFRKRKVQ